jgi:error-prone DNA polymerase
MSTVIPFPSRTRSTPTSVESPGDATRNRTGNASSNATEAAVDAEASAHAYAELHCLSDFSFQRGASSAEELFERAKKLGYTALAITDECSLAGIVRAHKASGLTGVRLIVGSELRLADGPTLILLVENHTGYSELCRLITLGRRRSEKGGYILEKADLESLGDGLVVLWSPDPATLPSRTSGVDALRQKMAELDAQAAWVARHFAPRAWLAVELHRGPDDENDLACLTLLGKKYGLPFVAAGDVHMHVRRRRALHDVMTAIRLGCTVAEAGNGLLPNGERHLRRLDVLEKLYAPALRAETLKIAGRCTFDLQSLDYRYPHEVVPEGIKPIDHLRQLTWQGAHSRWPDGIPEKYATALEHELVLVEKLEYEHFFLTVEDLVREARERNILCQGRGSAANSLICYCLGITAADPERIQMLFERFVSLERKEPPDIDVDFEHERREEIIQYVFDKYGRDRAAMAATAVLYRPKSAARDVGRALGYSEDQLAQLSHVYSHAHEDVSLDERLRERGFDPADDTLRKLTILVAELCKSPRHLSQHVGGFVISERPLHTLVPVENASMAGRTVIQWDKDDLEHLGLLKVDCLALGMLTCLRKGFDLLREHHGKNMALSDIPENDEATYEMIRDADTIGVFQIESRAQMSMLPRLKPANYYDLVVQIAIVRPGPIEGGMVHPYLRRRDGTEKADYPKSRFERDAGLQAEVEKVLARTLGVPIFQEQVMKLVQIVAGFTPGEADQLRRSMGTWRNDGTMEKHRDQIFAGMHERGYEREFAERLFSQIQGFGSYGFPESHSASFALLAYASSYLKCHYPEVFACALLNSQPMGFYAPAQIVQDARRHKVRVLPVDVMASQWDCTLEAHVNHTFALRLGFRMVKGLSESTMQHLAHERRAARFRDVGDLVRRAGIDRFERERLAEAGALKSLSGHRHQAHWDSAGAERPSPLLFDARIAESPVDLRRPSMRDDVHADYATLGLSLTAHPVALIRPLLRREHRSDSRQLNQLAHKQPVRTAGLVTVRQRPPAAGGVTFVTLEDECGQINLVVWQAVALKYRRALLEATFLGVDGVMQVQGKVRHLVARQLHDLSAMLSGFDAQSRDFH